MIRDDIASKKMTEKVEAGIFDANLSTYILFVT